MIRPLLLALALAAPAAAQQTPRVEVSLDPEGPVTVGTPLALKVTVLVPTYMPQPPVWPDFQIADAITRLPPHASAPRTVRIDGATWAGIERDYDIFPQRPADFTLPSATIAVTYADPDSNAPVTVQVPVPALAFSAVVPAGAEDLDPFLAAAGLTLAAESNGLPDAPKPGDALTLTLTATATGTPAMLLPPLAAAIAVPDGLRAYPKAPVLTDTPGQRGAPDQSARSETVTFVIERPGSYTLPGLTLRWWNTATGKVEEATTSPIAFATPPGPDPAAPARSVRPWIAAALALAAVLVAAWRLAPAIARWHEHRTASEPASFRRLRRTVRSGDVAALRPAVSAWLASANAAGPIPATVETALIAVERSAYGPSKEAARGGDLMSALERLRRALPGRRRAQPAAALPPLNPAV